VPPFSVLDARQGYWQDRKRAWIALGIKSELGRGENAAPGGGQDQRVASETTDTPSEATGAAGCLQRERERERVVRMALHNDPMQRKNRYASDGSHG
jgi:hypothetical protein